MNAIESAAGSRQGAAYTEQPAAQPVTEGTDSDVSFYIIGGIINITMILAYFVWAFRAWKKLDRKKAGAGKNGRA